MFCGIDKVKVTPSRFPGLGYAHISANNWRFVDLESDQVTGAIYPTRAELLADIESFAEGMDYTS